MPVENYKLTDDLRSKLKEFLSANKNNSKSKTVSGFVETSDSLESNYTYSFSLKDEETKKTTFKAVRMDDSFVPSEESNVISLYDENICSKGNIMLIIAHQGTGKSNISEAFASRAVSSDADVFGFEVLNVKKVLLIDTERTLNELHSGFNRMLRRAKVTSEMLNSVVYMYSFIEFETPAEMKKEAVDLIEDIKPDLVILDGVGDLVLSVNDEAEARAFSRWVTHLANKYKFATICTIHPNPNDTSGKGAGHLGTIMARKASSVWNLVKDEKNKNLRVLSTENAQGKVRSGSDSLKVIFCWSNEEKMFVSYTGSDHVFTSLLHLVFSEKSKYSYKDLIEAIIHYNKVMTGREKSVSWAKRQIKDWHEELEKVVKDSMGFYSLKEFNSSSENVQEESSEDFFGNISSDDVPF